MLVETHEVICGSHQASEKWIGCYFDKGIIDQLLWKIA